MQTKPRDARKVFAAVAVIGIMGLGFGLTFYPGLAARSSTTSQVTSYVTPSDQGHIYNARLSFSDLESYISGLYFGSAIDQALGIQLFSGTLTESLSNVTLAMPDGTLYHVATGTLTVQPTAQGLQVVFSGSASSGQVDWTAFTLVYSTLPTTTTTTAHASTVSPASLSPAFALLPSIIQTQVVAALNDSPNPGAQISFLANELQNETSILNAIPGLAGQGTNYAAAFLLNISTQGTAFANSAYSSLLGSATTSSSSTTTGSAST